jgi:uroporphyrinogen-III synthase
LKVKSILVTQPKPETEKSPYFDLAKKYTVKIDFREFIHVEGVPAKDFRKERVNILDHGAVIMTSRNAVDHYFRMCSEMRVTVPDTMKYFCISESTAFYLQKYVQYRKRKIFHGKTDLFRPDRYY